MSDIYAFSANDCNSEFLIESEIEKQLILLKDVEWFHSVLERKDAEKKIITNGEFLVRLSRGSENRFVVSTKWNGKFVHVIIKNDVDTAKHQLTYFIVPKFKFSSISELISFHKIEQYPLSNSSEAVLYRPVVATENNKKEHKFRKSVRVTHKSHIKAFPRSDSETLLASQRYSDTFTEMNKSLSNLPTNISDAPSKPSKPSLRLFTSKLVLPRNRPNNIQIRNDQLFKESGDYSDFVQSQDSSGGLQRERTRRGMSMDVTSPSLFGLNRAATRDGKVSSHLGRNESGGYLPLGHSTKSVYVVASNANNDISDYILPSKIDQEPSPYISMDNGSSFLSGRRVSAPAYVTSVLSETPSIVHRPSTLTLSSFLDLNLASIRLPCCGPIEGAFDTNAINKAATFLLSHPNNCLGFCVHLLHELRRIFQQASADILAYKPGYRSLFLPGLNQCQKDLSIRQSALTNFVKATIVNTSSNERRINLILFWVKCADYLLGHVRDMFHFRSVITAIFSDQISNLNVWKTIYRNDPSLQSRMKSLRNAIVEGCFMRTDIDQCVPDLVQLYNMFTGIDDDGDSRSSFDGFCAVSIEVAYWTTQSFDDPSTWLSKICSDINSITTIPFLRELVQTETLLSMILGKNTITYSDISPLMTKVDDCLRILSDLRNQTSAM